MSNYGGQGQNQYNSQLEQVCGLSFPSNHMLQIQLMREVKPPRQDGRMDQRAAYWAFVTIAPGVGEGSSRTYQFKDGSISQKFSLQEIIGLSFVLNQIAKGMTQTVLPYSKFTRGTSSKVLFINEMVKDQTVGNQQMKVRMAQLTIRDNGKNVNHSIQLSMDQAHAMAMSLIEIFKKGMDLELTRQITTPKQQQSYGHQNGAVQQPMQQAPMQQAPMQQAPMQQAPMQQAPMQQQFSNPSQVVSGFNQFMGS